MHDREKVIRAVGSCFDYWLEQHRWLHPLELENVRQLKDDSLALLETVEQKIGHWIVLENCSNAGVYCSECNTKIFDHYPMKKKLSQFCGHCGAKMEWSVKFE